VYAISAGTRVFLEISDVTTSSNTFFGTSFTTASGGIIVATITGQTANGDSIGLFSAGPGVQLEVEDSLYCGSTSQDVDLESAGTMNLFSNITCNTTVPSSLAPLICSNNCQE
jgi:hypothetical protein